MLRRKLEHKIDSLIGEKLQDSVFLARVLRDYADRLASCSQPEPPGLEKLTVVSKLDELRAKKGRVLDAFFDGVIDRAQRDWKLQEVDREIGSYNALLGTSSDCTEPPPFPNLDTMLQVIEPLADWGFLARDDRRTLLQQLCPEISVYRYTVKSLTLNVAAGAQSNGGDTGSRSKMGR